MRPGLFQTNDAEDGFTLVEVLVASALGALTFGILAVAISTVVLGGRIDVNAAQANAAARSLEASLLQVGYLPATSGTCPYSLTRGDVVIPVDPKGTPYTDSCRVQVYDNGSYGTPGAGYTDQGLQMLTVTVTPPQGGLTATVTFLKADRPTT